jgi:hypothetical protein
MNQNNHSRGNSTQRAYACSSSESSPSISTIKHQRRRHGSYSLQGGMKKINPPSFYGENKKGEDVESWLVGLRKYF